MERLIPKGQRISVFNETADYPKWQIIGATVARDELKKELLKCSEKF